MRALSLLKQTIILAQQLHIVCCLASAIKKSFLMAALVFLFVSVFYFISSLRFVSDSCLAVALIPLSTAVVLAARDTVSRTIRQWAIGNCHSLKGNYQQAAAVDVDVVIFSRKRQNFV